MGITFPAPFSETTTLQISFLGEDGSSVATRKAETRQISRNVDLLLAKENKVVKNNIGSFYTC